MIQSKCWNSLRSSRMCVLFSGTSHYYNRITDHSMSFKYIQNRATHLLYFDIVIVRYRRGDTLSIAGDILSITEEIHNIILIQM